MVLRPYEYASILQTFSPETVGVDSLGKPTLSKVEGRCVFQASSGLCTLQPLGMKPIACKLWPFAVYRRNAHRKRSREAIFRHGGENYYIYVNLNCAGVNRGDPRQLHRILREIVDISLEPSKRQTHSTSEAFTPQILLWF